uniref:PRELI/MSF1 domain-containing protein n=1 Tax=Glossina palpalis gambiensis TaxID=67801 RepID=A0A1B0C2L8_9MUSC
MVSKVLETQMYVKIHLIFPVCVVTDKMTFCNSAMASEQLKRNSGGRIVLFWVRRFWIYNQNRIFRNGPINSGSAKICFATECSTQDRNKRQMMLKPTNLTHCRHISADEVLYYKPHPTNSWKTLLKQEASISVRGVTLSHYMEDLLTSATSKNAGKGRQGLVERFLIFLPIILASLSAINVPFCVATYGEFMSLLIDRTVAIGTPSTTFFLPIYVYVYIK